MKKESGRAAHKLQRAGSGLLIGVVSALFAVYLSGLLIAARIAPVVPGIYIVVSMIAFIAYGLDKTAARRGNRRISESTLHLMALFCGWPGAYAAQRMLRHKTAKASFQRIFVFTVACNILGFIFWASRP